MPSTSSSVLVNSGSPRGRPRSITDSNTPSWVLTTAPACWRSPGSASDPRALDIAAVHDLACAGNSDADGVFVADTCTRSMNTGVISVLPRRRRLAADDFHVFNEAVECPGALTLSVIRPGASRSNRNRPVSSVVVVRDVPSMLTTASATPAPLCVTTVPATAPVAGCRVGRVVWAAACPHRGQHGHRHRYCPPGPRGSPPTHTHHHCLHLNTRPSWAYCGGRLTRPPRGPGPRDPPPAVGEFLRAAIKTCRLEVIRTSFLSTFSQYQPWMPLNGAV